MVRQQKAIINHVSKNSDKHGSDPKMKEAMRDYEKVSRKGGFVNSPVVLKR